MTILSAEGLQAFFTRDGTIFPAIGDTGKPPQKKETHQAYPISHLGELLDSLPSEKKQIIRFDVTLSLQALFGPEKGKTSHRRLNQDAPVKTAGNIGFSPDKATLEWISNKSGGYRPDTNSLQYILAILVFHERLLPFKLADNIKLVLAAHSVGDIREYFVPVDQLRIWAEHTFWHAKYFILSEQPKNIQNSTYGGAAASNHSQVHAVNLFERGLFGSASKRVRFSDEEDASLDSDHASGPTGGSC